MEHCWEEWKIFLLLASINLPGQKWVLTAWVQEHSHILWTSNLDSRMMRSAQSHRAGCASCRLEALSQSPPWTPCPANTGYIYHYTAHLYMRESRCDPAREPGAGCHWLHLHQECDLQQELTAITKLQLSIPVLTALEAHENCRAGKCFSVPCTSMHSQEVKVSLRLLVCLHLGVFFWGLGHKAAFPRLEKLSQLMIHPMQVGDRTFSFLRMMEAASS